MVGALNVISEGDVMDYSKMSDQEINKLVAFALGCKEVVPDIFMSDDRRYEFDKPKNKSGNKFFFDPCNNVADAWPIIVDKKIGLKPVRWNEWRAEGDDSCGFLSYTQTDKNPLRAAMIVLLMMQESANVQDNPA